MQFNLSGQTTITVNVFSEKEKYVVSDNGRCIRFATPQGSVHVYLSEGYIEDGHVWIISVSSDGIDFNAAIERVEGLDLYVGASIKVHIDRDSISVYFVG